MVWLDAFLDWLVTVDANETRSATILLGACYQLRKARSEIQLSYTYTLLELSVISRPPSNTLKTTDPRGPFEEITQAYPPYLTAPFIELR
jgi:hypothetical protein